MKPLRNLFDSLEPHFLKGGKLEKLFVVYEMFDTMLFAPGDVTKGQTHVRDGMDLKRMMFMVIIALQFCIINAIVNTGYQANLVIARAAGSIEGWRGSILSALSVGYNPASLSDNILVGLAWFVPIFIVVHLVGGFWEVVFASVRGHEVNEGFLVTGMLFPLILPPTMPLWQVALGISFGVVIGKEVFGGTGKNFMNPALTGRAFLFFAYPASISGDAVWVGVDGFAGATPLSLAAQNGLAGLEAGVSWSAAFWGTIPGSMGETSAAACLFGAVVLIATGVGSWRIIGSILFGALAMTTVLNELGSNTNLMFAVPFTWHLVMGGFLFGAVFMATDPVSAAMTRMGQFIYGILIGVMVILIRVVNPAFPEGMMLAILFGNVFAPLIDYYVVKANIQRRALRNG